MTKREHTVLRKSNWTRIITLHPLPKLLIYFFHINWHSLLRLFAEILFRCFNMFNISLTKYNITSFIGINATLWRSLALDITILFAYNKHPKKKKIKRKKKKKMLVELSLPWSIENEYEILTTYSIVFVEFLFSLVQVVERLVR